VDEPAEFEGEGEADWMMAVDGVEEVAMAAEMSDVTIHLRISRFGQRPTTG
jgi:hypothetical protein